MTKNQLDKSIVKAEKREDLDDHLTDAERKVIVDAYRTHYPEVPLPEDMTDAYCEIIFR